MFSYFGSKSKIIGSYPSPKYSKIIEPFAGSAKYSLKYFENEIILVDTYYPVFAIWNFLINSATEKSILSMPDVENATKLNSIQEYTQLSQEEKWLVGFCCNGGSAQPKNVSGRHNFNSWNRDKIRIANDLYKVKHWKIFNIDYKDVANEKVTWFIDPPYQDKGKWYPEHDIDYTFLGEWSRNRSGQIIVCENYGANWLPFEHLKDVAFSHFKNDEDKKKKTSEGIWYKED